MKFPWFRRKSQPTTRSILIDSLTNELMFCSLTGERVTPAKAFKFYAQNSSLATAVDMVSEAFEQINPIIKMPDGSTIEQSPILDLLRYPNSYMEWSGFASRISKSYLLTNQALFYGMGATTVAPTEIHPIKPITVSAETGNDEYVDYFDVNDGVAKGKYKMEFAKQRISRYYEGALRELYRVAGFSSLSTEAQPDSPMQAVALEINQQISGRVHNMKLLNNGGRPSLLVVFKDEQLTDDEHRERTRRINETFGGENNAGKIGVMSGGDIEKVQEMGTTQKDMDYAQLDQMAKESIFSRYKIPLPLITNEASTFNNLETGIQMMYDFAVLPLADKLFAGLTRFLLPRFGVSLGTYKISYNPDSLQPLMARKLEEIAKRKANGVETINEIRESIPNRKPLEGGDVLYQNATLVPLGMDMDSDMDDFDSNDGQGNNDSD